MGSARGVPSVPGDQRAPLPRHVSYVLRFSDVCVCTRHSAVCVIGDECVECKLLACGASYSSMAVLGEAEDSAVGLFFMRK